MFNTWGYRCDRGAREHRQSHFQWNIPRFRQKSHNSTASPHCCPWLYPWSAVVIGWCLLLWQHSFTFQMTSQWDPARPQGFCLHCTCDLLFINRNNRINARKARNLYFTWTLASVPVIPRWHLCTYLLIVNGAFGYGINKAITSNHESRTVLRGCVIMAISLPLACYIKLQYTCMIYPSVLTMKEAITCHILMT